MIDAGPSNRDHHPRTQQTSDDETFPQARAFLVWQDLIYIVRLSAMFMGSMD